VHPENFHLIHLVTHGVADTVNPLDSAIILSRGQNNIFKLYAHEIVKTKLYADLVIISACDSLGRKTFDGEGLVGLAWAFMRAGAHHVIAGLWKVDDRYTPQLMDDFYSDFQKTRSAVGALHAAKLKMLHSGTNARYPYYWAALQLYAGS